MSKKLEETKTIVTRKHLKFDLDHGEIAIKREKSLKLEEEIEATKAEIKAFTSKKKLEIKDIVDERKLLHAQIKSKKEERDVKCQEVYDYKKGTVTTMYDGRKMDQRAMFDSERQEEMYPTKKDFDGPETTKDVIKMETSKRTKHDASTSPN